MKLRNKKTGKILETARSSTVIKDKFRIYDEITDKYYDYNSLAELNEEWEDCDKTETYFIDAVGGVSINALSDKRARESFYKKLKAIGNYFETKEEAEKAVEKLKAWKRLEDKGLIFCGWKITDDGCSVDIETTLDAEVVRVQQKYITDDLNLLFGGEG